MHLNGKLALLVALDVAVCVVSPESFAVVHCTGAPVVSAGGLKVRAVAKHTDVGSVHEVMLKSAMLLWGSMHQGALRIALVVRVAGLFLLGPTQS